MSSMNVSASTATPPYEIDECQGVLRRSSKPSFDVPVDDDGSVVWRDVVFDPVHNLHLRLYKLVASTSSAKLSIFYYIHGEGFCIGSRTWPNPLITVVKWLQAQALAENPDPWLTHDAADFSKVFISGDSARGNIAHNLAVQLGPGSPDLALVQVKGYVVLVPFFGGTVRTSSGCQYLLVRFVNYNINLSRFWRLFAPIEAMMDHPLINPFRPASPSLEHMKLDPILVLVAGSDLLKERQEEYAQRLKKLGKKVQYAEFEGQEHCFFIINHTSQPAEALMNIIKQFISENSN
ncbi:hypothetical protein PTKIN_Ptkin11bG0069600 [Pterospermum kingtungense]